MSDRTAEEGACEPSKPSASSALLDAEARQRHRELSGQQESQSQHAVRELLNKGHTERITSNVLGRLRAFLPQMEEANRTLEETMRGKDPKEFQVDASLDQSESSSSDEASSDERHVEMNLVCGLLEKKGDSSQDLPRQGGADSELAATQVMMALFGQELAGKATSATENSLSDSESSGASSESEDDQNGTGEVEKITGDEGERQDSAVLSTPSHVGQRLIQDMSDDDVQQRT